MMKRILYVLSLCILGFAMSCNVDETGTTAKKPNTGTDKSGTTDKGGGTTDETKTVTSVPKPVSAELAFAEVVKVLHAPYSNGEYLFKIFPNVQKAAEVKQGTAITVGKSDTAGDGTYTIIVAKDEAAIPASCGAGHPIIYTYKDYQPKGSLIIVNGSLTSSRTEAVAPPSIQFCKGVDTLTMSGHFDATLKLTSAGNAYGIKAANIMVDLSIVFPKNSIEFTYEGKVMNLSDAQIETLFTVNKS